jgi:hypothetical protein
VLALYGKKGIDCPILRRTILSYALACKTDKEAAKFIETRRAEDPALVEELEDSLKYDK